MQPQSPAEMPRRHRRWRILLLIAVLAVTIISIGLWSGRPQRALVTWGLSSFLGADATVGEVSLSSGRIRISGVTLRDEEAGASGEDPIRLEGIEIGYDLFPEKEEGGPRYVRSLSIESIRIRLEKSAAASNHHFLQAFLSAPASDFDPLPYLPYQTKLRLLDLSILTDEGRLSLEGLGLSCALEDLEHFSVALAGEAISGEAWTRRFPGDSARFQKGLVDLCIGRDGGDYALEKLQVVLPGLLEGAASASWHPASEGAAIEAHIPSLSLRDAAVAPLSTAFLPFPVSFESLSFNDSHLRAIWNETGLQDAHGEMQIQAQSLQVGPAEAPYYSGNARLEGRFEPTHSEATAVLGQGQRLDLTVDQLDQSSKLRLQLAEWSRDELLAATPAPYRHLLEALPGLSRASLAAETIIQPKLCQVDLSSTLGFASPETGLRTLEVAAHGRLDSSRVAAGVLDGSISLDLADGTMKGTVNSAESPGQFESQWDLSGIDLAAWLETALAHPAPGLARGMVSGTMKLKGPNSMEGEAELTFDGLGERDQSLFLALQMEGAEADAALPVQVSGRMTFPGEVDAGTLDFTARIASGQELPGVSCQLAGLRLTSLASRLPALGIPSDWEAKVSGALTMFTEDQRPQVGAMLRCREVMLGDLRIPPEDLLEVDGVLSLSDQWTQCTAEALAVTWEEKASLALTGAQAELSPFRLQATLTADADFAKMSAEVPWAGRAKVQAPIRMQNDLFSAQLHFSGTGFGYPPIVPRAGVPTTVDAAVAYHIEPGRVDIQGLAGTWGEATRLAVPEAGLTLDPFTLSAPFEVETDFAPLVDLGWLASSGPGQARFSGTSRFAQEAVDIETDLVPTGATIALLDDWALLEQMEAGGHLRFDGTIQGAGTLEVGQALALGAALKTVKGKWRAEGDTFYGESLSGTVFSGTVTGSAEMAVLKEDLSGRGTFDFSSIDLAQFSKEFDLPEGELAGLADGQVELRWNAEGLQSLHTHLHAETGLSVNRDLLVRILLAEYMKEGLVGKRLNRIVNASVGEAPQHSFLRGDLTLDLIDNRYVGKASLDSESLKLSLDIAVDEGVIAEAIWIQQTAQIAGFGVPAAPSEGRPPEQGN